MHLYTLSSNSNLCATMEIVTCISPTSTTGPPASPAGSQEQRPRLSCEKEKIRQSRHRDGGGRRRQQQQQQQQLEHGQHGSTGAAAAATSFQSPPPPFSPRPDATSGVPVSNADGARCHHQV
jgi:hypothetical protein